jgi:hypothetical protein
MKRALLLVVVVAAGWLALVLHPQPLFAYTASRDNIVLHARRPFPPATQTQLQDVLRRVSASPLYDAGRVHDVFLCDTPALYGALALWAYKSGGLTQALANGHVFIRPSDIQRGTVFGRSGEVKNGRPLAYFIAHEVTHAMTADRIGRWRDHRLAAFQKEGYADHVAFARPLDWRAERTALIQETPEMNPSQSGLYRRYELLVAYLLDQRGMSIEELLARPLDRKVIEDQLRAEP